MKLFLSFCLLMLIISCKEKTFADDIILKNDSDVPMKFQEFNEGLDDAGSSIIYIGKSKGEIPIKYYPSFIPSLLRLD